MVVGHEIVGKAVRVGSQAEKGIKVGDRVGVGAESESCMNRAGDCEQCASGLENYCQSMVITYNSRHFNGGVAQGGYARYKRCPSRFVFKIPDAIPSADAAPMLCAGITCYSPLKHWGAGPGKRVGIIGLGGLGHFGVLFAKALGADKVVVISRSASKRDDAMKLGADEYIAIEEDQDWAKHHAWSLDLIVSTVSSSQVSRDRCRCRGSCGIAD
jgi:alcohol dehydrogenase (NADP+)